MGDGSLGIPEQAPFDGIVVAAATSEIPPALVEQLAEGARLVLPLGPGGAEVVMKLHKRGGHLEEGEILTPAAFVPLVAQRDAGRR